MGYGDGHLHCFLGDMIHWSWSTIVPIFDRQNCTGMLQSGAHAPICAPVCSPAWLRHCSWQNGTWCRDGVKVLWCLVWSIFEGSIPTCAWLFSFQKLLLYFYWVVTVFFFFEHNRTLSGKEMMTGVQVVTTSQVQSIGCRWQAILSYP